MKNHCDGAQIYLCHSDFYSLFQTLNYNTSITSGFLALCRAVAFLLSQIFTSNPIDIKAYIEKNYYIDVILKDRIQA